MNIWLVTIGEPLPVDAETKKMRTSLLADKLLERNHQVTLFVSAFNHFSKKWIYESDVNIKLKENYFLLAITGTGYKKNISLQRFIDHRTIANKFSKIASKLLLPDAIVVSMPPHDLAFAVVAFAKKNNIPVLVDVRDPWPDIFFQSLPSLFRNVARIIFYKSFGMLKYALSNASGLVSVTETMKQWSLMKAGRNENENDKVFYLGHFKQKEIKESERFKILAEKLKDKFVVFFVGTISPSFHNPLILLSAAKKLLANENIYFVIAGDGELLEKLKAETENIKNVTLTGWLNREEIEFWLRHAAVGVCPVSKKSDLPTNKAYAYLSAGLPLVSSFDGDLKTLIEKEEVGIYYPPGDTDALVNSILKLYEDKLLRKKYSENAKKVFEKYFDAEIIYESYATYIEDVAKKNNSK
jgi:glycosyltransferase involved in cell wall biosynthesis